MTDEKDPHKRRSPRAIRVEDPPASAPAGQALPRRPAALSTEITMTADADDPFLQEAEAISPPDLPPRRGLTAGRILLAAAGFLVSLALGLWVDALIEDLFARLPWLGWTALAVTGLGLVALLVIVLRELAGLRRLANVADLRADIAARRETATAAEARRLADRVATQLGARPQTARGRAALKEIEGEIVDGPQLLSFAERELFSTLDREARQLVLNAARRVSVVTAVSPRALVDVAYVGFEAVRLVRAMATLYGGRPGTIGLIRLFRDVIAHLAVTGTVAAGDSLVQQVLGHGLAARLSARLGEGVINGLMTARIGISAMDLCRPMPFHALKRPRTAEFLTDLSSLSERGRTGPARD